MSIIKIQTQSTAVPIEFGELEFSFETSDESVQAFYKNVEQTKSELESMEIEKGNELESLKKILRKGFESFLGEGAFDKIYEQTPSVINLAPLFMQLAEAITAQLKDMGMDESQKTKVEKYLRNKKK